MKKKLVCVLACRNQGSRLYGKPLQNLDIKKRIKVIDFLINRIKKIKSINSIVLAISDTIDNQEYINISKRHSLKFVIGDEIDVLNRLILGGKKLNATDVFRVTSESPFTYNDNNAIQTAWNYHQKAEPPDKRNRVLLASTMLISFLLGHDFSDQKNRQHQRIAQIA